MSEQKKPTDAKLGRSDNPDVWNPPEPKRGRWDAMTLEQQFDYVVRLERAVLDMGKELGMLRQQVKDQGDSNE
jgi:hypothetical protein